MHFLIVVLLQVSEIASRSFVVDYENDRFLKDGEPFTVISGSMHYMRVVPENWIDRMRKLRLAGFNTLQTYVEWSSHEPEPDEYEFAGRNDLEGYIRQADAEGLLVSLRIGPYICTERDFGGLPYWLLKKKSIGLRTDDPDFISAVESWFDVLLPMIKPHLYQNGGPIIMVQIENEYGSYGCNPAYLSRLRDIVKTYLEEDVVYFTTDGDWEQALQCGSIQGTLMTVDFGSEKDVGRSFAVLRKLQPKGPLVNSEFYAGWLDYWGYPHSTVGTDIFVRKLEDIIRSGASFNVYMFHGGTSYGLTTGCSYSPGFRCCTTSYDYDALLDESGDPTEKYHATRQLLAKYFPVPEGPVPGPIPKGKYGRVQMHYVASLETIIDQLYCEEHTSPLTFEDLDTPEGFVLYSALVTNPVPDHSLLSVPGLRDRGYVYVDQTFVGILSRVSDVFSISLHIQRWQTVSILVENQGRIFYGAGIHDPKGILGEVTLSDFVLANWTMCPVPILDIIYRLPRNKFHSYRKYNGLDEPSNFPKIFLGFFSLPKRLKEPLDTFLDLKEGSWGKGVVLINYFNLGRYWSTEGPQWTLYVPKQILRPYPEKNMIAILEQESAPCLELGRRCHVRFVDHPIINGSTPNH